MLWAESVAVTPSLRSRRAALMPAGAALLLAFLAAFTLTACRSAFVETTIENTGPASIHLIEVDYPSASFGMQSLDAHGTYHYHFKIQGSGPITITWTDAANKAHTATGPKLFEGQSGDLRITIDAAGGVSWSTSLSADRH